MQIANEISDEFFKTQDDVTDIVREIIDDVRKNGDEAVKKYMEHQS